MARSQNQVLRMLAMVPYLQSSNGLNVRDVARELGVTPKQLTDDLKLLMMTGAGEGGGDLIDVDLTALEEEGVIHLRDADFMTRPLRISGQEGAALVVALRTLRASASGDQIAIIDSALAKIEAALGSDAGAPVDVVLDEVDAGISGTVAQAVAQGRRLALTYANETRDEQSERQVDPVRVFTERGRMYLEAWCLRAEDIRFFRLDRVISAELTDEHVAEHDADPVDLSEGVFTVGPDTPFALIKIDGAVDWLAEYYPVEVVEEHADGTSTAKLFGSDWGWLCRLVLRNAGLISVLEPAELKAQVTDSARAALAAYDG